MQKLLIALCIILIFAQPLSAGAATSDWKVEFLPLVGYVGEVVDLRVEIKTSAGQPVNNAIVTWSSDAGEAFLSLLNEKGEWVQAVKEITVDSAVDHVNSGVYKRSVKLRQAGHVRIKIYTRHKELVMDTSTWIGGEEEYLIEVVSEEPRALLEQALDIKVLKQDGSVVTSLDVLRVEGAGVSRSLLEASLKDFDDDGKVDGYRIMVRPTFLGEMEIFAATGMGNIYGSAKIAVQTPCVSISPQGALTKSYPAQVVLESMESDSEGEKLPFYYRLSGSNVSFAVGEGNYTQFVRSAKAEVKHVVDILPRTLGVNPQMRLDISFNGSDWVRLKEWTVNDASIQIDKSALVVSKPNWVNIKLLDANNEPCAMAIVELLDGIGITNELGEATLLVTPQSIGKYKLRAYTIHGAFLEREINVVAEMPKQKWVLELGVANPHLGLTQPPVLLGGRVLLPFRWFGESILGATVDYFVEQGQEYITLQRGSTFIKLYLNGTQADVNDMKVNLDVAPQIIEGRALVPARFLAETFDYNVTWLESLNQVVIEQR